MTASKLQSLARVFTVIGLSALAVSLGLQFYVRSNEPIFAPSAMTHESFRLYQEQKEPFRRLSTVATWLLALGTVCLTVNSILSWRARSKVAIEQQSGASAPD
jgi:hypothetical protein